MSYKSQQLLSTIYQRFRFHRRNSYSYIHPVLQRATVIGNIGQIICDNVTTGDNARRHCTDIGSHTKASVHSKLVAGGTLM